MSKHHHHPNEGHGDGVSTDSAKNHLHHNWFFYVAGFFILLALLGFIFSGNLAWQPTSPPTPPAPVSSDGR